MSIPLEVCIDSYFAFQAAKAAYEGGAERIELCSQMNLDGLTPSIAEINLARKAFLKSGLMVMVRPKAGNFVYSLAEQKQMLQHIQEAKDSGASGVVFGILEHESINLEATRELVALAKSLGLSTTFHRAFDAIESREEALDNLIELGIERVLTSGTAWGSNQGALEGLPVIQALLEQAQGRIEIIVGGRINATNIKQILQRLEPHRNFSIHTYSGVQENSLTTGAAVKMLKDLIAGK